MARKARGAVEAAPAEVPKLLRGERRTVDTESLTPHPLNARRGNVPAIKESIRENGFYGDVFVWKQTGQIIVGSHRWKAARELRMPRIPVVLLDLTEAQAMKILAVDNKTSDLADYDDQRLVDLLKHIVDVNGSFAGTGYAQEDLDAVLKKIQPPSPPEQFRDLNPGGMQLLRTCPKCGFQF